MRPPIWQFSGGSARLRWNLLTCVLSPGRPDDGVEDIRHADQSWKALRPLQVGVHGPNAEVSPRLDELLARQNELMASYRIGEDVDLAATIHWKAVPVQHDRVLMPAIDLTVLLTTTLLECPASLTITGRIPANETWTLAGPETDRFEQVADRATAIVRAEPGRAGLFLFRVPGLNVSYAEMIAPGDFREAEVTLLDEPGRVCEVRYPLFGDRLEKGVIRCCRIRAMLLPQERDQMLAAGVFREWIENEPPLAN